MGHFLNPLPEQRINHHLRKPETIRSLEEKVFARTQNT